MRLMSARLASRSRACSARSAPAGAAVAVTYYFLVFLKDQSEKQNRLFEDFKDYHTESQKKFQDQLDRLSDRQEQSQRGFQDQVTRITESQNLLLRDAILAMKAVEKSQDGATDTIRGLEKTIASLQLAVRRHRRSGPSRDRRASVSRLRQGFAPGCVRERNLSELRCLRAVGGGESRPRLEGRLSRSECSEHHVGSVRQYRRVRAERISTTRGFAQ